jgi:hypothetical protein
MIPPHVGVEAVWSHGHHFRTYVFSEDHPRVGAGAVWSGVGTLASPLPGFHPLSSLHNPQARRACLIKSPPFGGIYYTSIRSWQHRFPLTLTLTLSRKWKRDKKEDQFDPKTTSIISIQTEHPPTTIFHPATQCTLRALPRRKGKS